MARHLSNYLSGYQDYASVPDWCEFINLENRCEGGSYYEVIYGSSCSRWCAPLSDAGRKLAGKGKNFSKKPGIPASGNGDDGKRYEGYAAVEIQSTGGWGGGGCCCTQPSSGGGQGIWVKECHKMYPGYFACFVTPHPGCCRTDINGCHGCWSLYRNQSETQSMCAEGGWCGGTHCWSMYCCVDQTFNSGQWCTGNDCAAGSQVPKYGAPSDPAAGAGYHINNGAQIHTIFFRSCQNNIGNYAKEGFNSERAHGRMPWLSNPTDNVGGNSIPCGVMCQEQKTWNNRYKGWNGNETSLGEHCGAAAHCQRYYTTPRAYEHAWGSAGWTGRECFAGCIGENCGVKIIVGAPGRAGNIGTQTRKVSGNSWEIVPFINSANTCGGFEHIRWHMCAWGYQGDLGCQQNIRDAGRGGIPTAVCGQPCCCGGQPGPGVTLIRYR